MDDRWLSRRERYLQDDDYYRHRRYFDRRNPHRGEIGPHSSVFHYRGRRDCGYSSDDMVVCPRQSPRRYREKSPYHKRHIAEGAIAGIWPDEMLRYHQKRYGRPPVEELGRINKDFRGGAVDATAAGMS